MPQNLALLKLILTQSIDTSAERCAMFFKNQPGQYGEHDQFMGIKVPTLRLIARQFSTLSLPEIQELLQSKFNEERLLAVFVLVNQYQKGEQTSKETIFNFYLQNLSQVNNWNLVDSSAHLIIGAHLFNQNRDLLIQLAQSNNLWERRIAIVSTWYFIRKQDLYWTFKIALLLLPDQHDLIHKATGWMLREAGKRDLTQLINFLNLYSTQMPRTALRYAIERFPTSERLPYLKR
jgi:3-methyladenine DNA glycosylase AlkD